MLLTYSGINQYRDRQGAGQTDAPPIPTRPLAHARGTDRHSICLSQQHWPGVLPEPTTIMAPAQYKQDARGTQSQ